MLSSFTIDLLDGGEYTLNWVTESGVKSVYSEVESVYVVFYLVPSDEGVEYRNKRGVRQPLGDGFRLDEKSYSTRFDSAWNIESGQEYKVVAELRYQPRDFVYDPQHKKMVIPS